MWAGCVLAVAAWYGCVKWLPIDAFNRLPDPVTVVVEWFNPDPDYGLSVFTADYYLHIWYSTKVSTVPARSAPEPGERR